MTSTHSHYGQRRATRRVDVASVALLVCGIVFGIVSCWLITERGANPLILLPSGVAVMLGATHLVKREAPHACG